MNQLINPKEKKRDLGEKTGRLTLTVFLAAIPSVQYARPCLDGRFA